MSAPAWLAVTAILLAACGQAQTDVDRWLQRMHDQPKAGAYGASPVFPDGKVMQAPPAGTVAREDVLEPGTSAGRDSSGGYLARVPLPMTPQMLAKGRTQFRVLCGACHGAGGFGGSVVAGNWDPPRPPSLRAGPAAVLPPGQNYEVGTNGFGRMPSYAADLPSADRWAVVAYVLAVRGREPADSAERDDAARAAGLVRRDSLAHGVSP
ncbi:MAG: c-type cytochrome [Gemmatimonadales bacterium]